MSDVLRVPERRLGRLPRTFDPTMPAMSSVRMMAGTKQLPPIPKEVHWADKIDDNDIGMMLNDRLGCCTCASAYHAMQVWSMHGRDQMIIEPDKYVEQMYREFGGWDGTPETDQGAIEQDILRQWFQTGVPIKEGISEHNPKPGRSFLRSAMEVYVRDSNQVKRAIYYCGGVYIGFDVPAWLMESPELPKLWGVQRSNSQLSGGHAIFCPGYDEVSIDVMSWGTKYKMTWEFWREYVIEAYALTHPWWIEATGLTPFGLPVDQLHDQMADFCKKSVTPVRRG